MDDKIRLTLLRNEGRAADFYDDLRRGEFPIDPLKVPYAFDESNGPTTDKAPVNNDHAAVAQAPETGKQGHASATGNPSAVDGPSTTNAPVIAHGTSRDQGYASAVGGPSTTNAPVIAHGTSRDQGYASAVGGPSTTNGPVIAHGTSRRPGYTNAPVIAHGTSRRPDQRSAMHGPSTTNAVSGVQGQRSAGGGPSAIGGPPTVNGLSSTNGQSAANGVLALQGHRYMVFNSRAAYGSMSRRFGGPYARAGPLTFKASSSNQGQRAALGRTPIANGPSGHHHQRYSISNPHESNMSDEGKATERIPGRYPLVPFGPSGHHDQSYSISDPWMADGGKATQPVPGRYPYFPFGPTLEYFPNSLYAPPLGGTLRPTDPLNARPHYEPGQGRMDMHEWDVLLRNAQRADPDSQMAVQTPGAGHRDLPQVNATDDNQNSDKDSVMDVQDSGPSRQDVPRVLVMDDLDSENASVMDVHEVGEDHQDQPPTDAMDYDLASEPGSEMDIQASLTSLQGPAPSVATEDDPKIELDSDSEMDDYSSDMNDDDYDMDEFFKTGSQVRPPSLNTFSFRVNDEETFTLGNTLLRTVDGRDPETSNGGCPNSPNEGPVDDMQSYYEPDFRVASSRSDSPSGESHVSLSDISPLPSRIPSPDIMNNSNATKTKTSTNNVNTSNTSRINKSMINRINKRRKRGLVAARTPRADNKVEPEVAADPLPSYLTTPDIDSLVPPPGVGFVDDVVKRVAASGDAPNRLPHGSLNEFEALIRSRLTRLCDDYLHRSEFFLKRISSSSCDCEWLLRQSRGFAKTPGTARDMYELMDDLEPCLSAIIMALRTVAFGVRMLRNTATELSIGSLSRVGSLSLERAEVITKGTFEIHRRVAADLSHIIVKVLQTSRKMRMLWELETHQTASGQIGTPCSGERRSATQPS
ncbi:hypothetical protein AAL_04551 [Moelleriella libera RCEF 2490]|uniref:Uncharacterized protein n=1 Tax=Moelleriella libera RCEF 2490 TaxID=1081109 RepID=A0A166P9Z9_9HYPO|nr:hypothetical protein AAL_04551 [Moelleriella libera RCEF 2490]